MPQLSTHRVATGAPRDFAALGRGVPPGKDTTTTLRQASARLVEIGEIGQSGDGGGAAATRIDLLGDRFLRRQVRVLVAAVSGLSLSSIALVETFRILACISSCCARLIGFRMTAPPGPTTILGSNTGQTRYCSASRRILRRI